MTGTWPLLIFNKGNNMDEINLTCWEEFEDQIKRLENERHQKKSSSKFLYRGHGRQKWKLLTTLERHFQRNLSLREYYRLIWVVKHQIESFTEGNWNIPAYPNGFDKWLEDYGNLLPHAFSSLDSHKIYGYLADLRHYGFPSPLLDWSSSPYVAAYFAFRDVLQCEEDVSIYVYLESTSEYLLKGGSSSSPHIHRFGPYVKTDRRHFIQQSQYTICIINDGDWRYEPHDQAFARNNPSQDLLWKYNIPHSERLKVLKLLDGYNINSLSLFGSKESLMETMTLREIYFRDNKS